jgi:hypothetical protein
VQAGRITGMRFLAQAIFELTPLPYKYPNKLTPVILPAYTAYKDETGCSETSEYKIKTPGKSPKRKNTTFRTRQKFEIKNNTIVFQECQNIFCSC